MINKLFILLLIVTTISSCKKDEDNDGPSKLDVPELLIPSNNSIASYGNINFNWSDVIPFTKIK